MTLGIFTQFIYTVWTLSCAIVRSWSNFYSPKVNNMVMNMTQTLFGFNTMVSWVILPIVHSIFCKNSFPAVWSPYERKFHRPLAPMNRTLVTLFFGDTSKLRFTKCLPRTLTDLMEAITDIIGGITQYVLRRVSDNFFDWCNKCIAQQHRHVDDIICETQCK